MNFHFKPLAAATLLMAMTASAHAVTEVTWWYSNTGALSDRIQAMTQQFNESQKDYRVKAIYKGGYDESMAAAIAAYRAGNAPNILQVFEVGTATMMHSKGAVVSVTRLMKDAGEKFDPKAYVPAVASYYTSEKGEMMSLPFNSSTTVFYYNKDKFEKAGLDPNKPPVTWEDVVSAAAKLKDTPSGSVTFRYDAGSTHITIGTSTLGSCLLVTCTVSRSTSSLPAGSGTITATYSGDTLLAASSASRPVTVNYLPEPPPAQSTGNSCGSGQTCTTSTIQVSDGTNTDKLTVTAQPSSGSQSVSGSLTPGASLDCPRQAGDSDPGQALATFDNSAPDASKSVVYRIEGPASVTVSNNYGNSTDRLVCFASPTPFNGWSPSGYGPAPLYTTPYGQFYEAELGSCVNHSGYRPCFQLLDGSALPSPYIEITVNTQPGDPKIYP